MLKEWGICRVPFCNKPPYQRQALWELNALLRGISAVASALEQTVSSREASQLPNCGNSLREAHLNGTTSTEGKLTNR